MHNLHSLCAIHVYMLNLKLSRRPPAPSCISDGQHDILHANTYSNTLVTSDTSAIHDAFNENYLFLWYTSGCVRASILNTKTSAQLRTGSRSSRSSVVGISLLVSIICADFPAGDKEADDKRDPTHSSHHGDSAHTVFYFDLASRFLRRMPGAVGFYSPHKSVVNPVKT